MKMMTLNLASRPFRNNTVVGSALLGVTIAILLATAYNLYFFLHYGSNDRLLQETQQRDRAALERVEAEEAKLTKEIQARDFRRLYDRSRFAGELILKRSFSWTLLFNNLEGVMPPDVIMTAIRPNITSDVTVVRVDGVAKSSGAFIALQDKLQSNKVFARVYPISERKLNPSRPEITFALSFVYLPKVAAAPAVVVASSAGAAAGPDAPPQAVPAGGSATAPAAGSPAGLVAGSQAPPTAAAARSATEPPPARKGPEAPPQSTAQASSSVSTPAPVKGTVGRDGRPRTPDLLALIVAAPGGAYLPPGAKPAAAGESEGGGARPPARPAASPAPVKAPRAGSDAKAPAAGTGSHANARAGGGSVPPGPSQVMLPPAVPPQAGPGAPPGAVRRTPGETQGPGLRPRSARLQDLSKPLTTAVRLDLPMRFSGRPVKEIYDALAKAHGVRFDLDAGVDPQEKVSADIAGRNLADAISIVARAAGHSVKRAADGSYRVTVSSGGEPISERPVREESLPAEGVKP
jgi:hypothetical protein